jgi:hypothetical protein
LHSRPEHFSTYFLDESSGESPSNQSALKANPNLDIMHSAQVALGYSKTLRPGLNLSVETYFQHLYKVAVEQDTASKSSILNAASV